MADNSKLQEKLVGQIEGAYAMENQIVETLQKQVQATKDYPNVQARIREHLAATELHRRRMEERLAAYGKKPSGLKSALSAFMGNAQGLMGAMRPDTLALMGRDDYVVEHFEIASYAILISMARAFGDEETVRACELNLRDEIDMQAWLAQHLPEATLMVLQKDGIVIPDTAWDLSKQAESTGIRAVFTATDTPAAESQPAL